MVACENCLRANPPTRTSCLYCAAALPATPAGLALQQPTLRRLEKWEHGFNSILIPERTSHFPEEVIKEAASLLKLQPEDFRHITEMNEPVPVARAASAEEANLVERKLGELNLKVLTIADHDLAANTSATKRVHALELTENGAVAHSHGEPQRAAWDEITLMVVGHLFVRQIEVEERKSRKAENKIIDARELSMDEAVLDIYTAQTETSWRIAANNFNFSCLGAQKALLAGQNFSTLVKLLRERAVNAVYDDSYSRVRRALTIVWPPEQRTESRGLRRGGAPGRVSSEAVTTSDNELQFTRYSRLRNYLRLHQT